MFLSKKDTPMQFRGMWYAGLLNIFVCYTNLMIHVFLSSTAMSFIASCISMVAAIVIFTVIKRQSQKILWDKLRSPLRDTFNDDVTEPRF